MTFEFEDPEDELPHDCEAEYQLIGWVLCNPKLISQVMYLDTGAFYYGLHAEIWEAIKALDKQGKNISPFTIKPLLKSADVEGVISSIEYLAKSVSASLLMLNPIEGAKYLDDLRKKRELGWALAEISISDDLEKNAGKISRLMSQLNEKTDNEFEDNLTVSDQIIKDMQDKKLPYSTGLVKMDKAMDGGLYSGKSYGFAARKKVGKTAFAATISANLNLAGVKHLFICGEMSPKEIHQRVLARAADIFPSAFRSDYKNAQDCQKKLIEAIGKMPRNTIYKNAPGLTFDALRQICTVAIEKHKVKGIILDYWQLVGGKEKNKSTAEHLDEVAQWIADFARTYDVWTITMAQINQEGNTRGGEGIRLAFDQLYQIHRENLTEPDAWIEMMETRYTPWINIGSKEQPGLLMIEKGPYFQES